MKIELEPLEARVIGCLIEKQITTPDQYPLSLNALTNACNQKSNRDPVMNLDEATVQRTLDTLARKHLVIEKSGFGSRVQKYQHRFCNTEFGTLKLSPQELAIACELLLRGPQTPGELRTRASRMAPFSDVTEVEAVLKNLAERADGPFVVRLAREPGRRESRYAHLFGQGTPENIYDPSSDAYRDPAPASSSSSASAYASAPNTASTSSRQAPSNDDRLTALEAEVRRLRAELDELKRLLPAQAPS